METKVMLTLIGERIAVADTLKEAYCAVRRIATAADVNLPSYEDLKKQLQEDKRE